MHSSSKRLRGVLPALITPFDGDGGVDLELFATQVDYLVGEGVDGFFVTGTTSEGAFITMDERVRLVKLVKERTREDLLCCVAVIAPDTSAVLPGFDSVAALAPDFVSAVTPFYLGVSQRDVVHHFVTLADRSPAPLILYDIPQNSHNPLELATVLELVDHPNIAGIKDSSGVFMSFQRGLLATGDRDFTWIQGGDLLDAPALLMGARCIVTGLGNAWIAPYVSMYRSAVDGDAAEVIRAQQRINELFRIIPESGGAGIAAIKSAAALQGRSSPCMRIASMQLGAEQEARVAAVLAELGLDTRCPP